MKDPKNQNLRVVVIALISFIIVFFFAYEIQHP